MPRPRHPNKEIEAAVAFAESRGWTLRKGGGHAWGVLYCPIDLRGGCRRSVYSTPSDADNHARHIRRAVGRCPHPTVLGNADAEEA